MDPVSIEKIRAMNKYSKTRRQLQQLPTVSLYFYLLVATCFLGLLLTSPAWFPRLCSALGFFFLTTLPDLVMAFLLSPKCLFVVGNLIIAFLVGESRLTSRRDDDQPCLLVNKIHEDQVQKNTAVAAAAAATAAAVADHSAFVGAVGKEVEMKEEEEEGEEEELHRRVEDFIARVKKQRKLELKSFFDVDR